MAEQTRWFFDGASCNESCLYCYSDWREYPAQASSDEMKRCIDHLVDNGVRLVSFSGGEPLLRKDIGELLRYSKDKGLRAHLVTNGLLLEERLDEIRDYVDAIGLPLDSACRKVHNDLRPNKLGVDTYTLTLHLLDILQSHSHISKSINTVVTKKNVGTISPIGDLISGKVNYWVVNQFRASGFGFLHKDKFDVTDEVFAHCLNACITRHPELKIYDFHQHRDTGCRIITPYMRVKVTTPQGIVDLGYIFDLQGDDLHRLYAMDELTARFAV